MTYKYDALTIQITPVWADCQGDYRYLYEEFNHDDICVYSHFISKEQVARLYPEALVDRLYVPGLKAYALYRLIRDNGFGGDDMKKAQVIAAVSEAKLQLAWAKNHPDESATMIQIADKCLNLALKMLTEQTRRRVKHEG